MWNFIVYYVFSNKNCQNIMSTCVSIVPEPSERDEWMVYTAEENYYAFWYDIPMVFTKCQWQILHGLCYGCSSTGDFAHWKSWNRANKMEVSLIAKFILKKQAYCFDWYLCERFPVSSYKIISNKFVNTMLQSFCISKTLVSLVRIKPGKFFWTIF